MVLDELTRQERDALRSLLIAATAGAPADELDGLLAVAPVYALPAAAAMHRVVGPVRAALRDLDRTPATVLEELSAIAGSATLAHLRYVGALHEVTDAFDAAGLTWAVMKGPVLAGRYYPEPGDRGYSDLDLLVATWDFGAAMRILEDAGYEHSIRNWALAEEMLAGQVGMSRGPIRVDLHWHLHYAREDRRPYDLRPEEMLGRTRRVAVSGLCVPTFDPVDTVIGLAFHAARSDGHALVWSKDIERVIASDRPDPAEVVRRSQFARCAPAVGLMLMQARDLVGADVSEDPIVQLVPRSLAAAYRASCRLSPPIQLHARPTVTRFVVRSSRPSAVRSLAALPARSARRIRRILFTPPPNETDDPAEKASYVRAVGRARDR